MHRPPSGPWPLRRWLLPAVLFVMSGVVALPQASAQSLLEAFAENRGQTDVRARFVAEQGALSIFAADAGLVLGHEGGSVELRFDGACSSMASHETGFASGHARVHAVGEPLGHLNILRGSSAESWLLGVPAYESLQWSGLPGGAAVRLHGALEYDLLLPAGTPLDAVALQLHGAEWLSIDEQGRLVAELGTGRLLQHIPAAWQELPGGARAPITTRFRLLGGGRFGFEAPGRQLALPLVVDPVLQYQSYLGGSLRDEILAVADAGDGALVVAGLTTSGNFPATPGSAQRGLLGYGDAFVARLLVNGGLGGESLPGSTQWVTYLGGTDSGFFVGEGASGVAVDAAGSVFVCGWSNSADFPATPGALQPVARGGVDAFVARFTPAGALSWCSFLGGDKEDRAAALALTPSGVIVTGRTYSNGLLPFPTTAGAFDTSFNSIFFTPDGFLSKLSLDGSTLPWSTLLGGVLRDEPQALAADAAGRAYVAGLSGSVDFPTTAGAYDESYGGPSADETDAFLCRVSADGANLEWSTLLGGTGVEEARCLALTPGGDVLVGGRVVGTDFPTTVGGLQPVAGGAADGFVTRLSADGSSLVWSSFLGGAADEAVQGLAVDTLGAVTVLAATRSAALPVTSGAYQASLAGGEDGYLARWSPEGTARRYASYLGAAGDDTPLALSVDAHGAARIVGRTTSSGWTATQGAVDPSYAGLPGDAGEGFLTCLELPPWANMGFAKLGSNGLLPRLVGAGSLEVDSVGTLTLTRARPSALALLFAGFVAGNVPFKGGVLVPIPWTLSIALVTLPDGSMPLGWAAWPAGLPPGFSVYMQYWITDPALESGLSASNAVRGTQP